MVACWLGGLGGVSGGAGKTMKTKGDKTIDKTISKRAGLLLEIGRPRVGFQEGSLRGGPDTDLGGLGYIFSMI